MSELKKRRRSEGGWADSHEPVVRAETLPEVEDQELCESCGGSGYDNHSGAWSDGSTNFCNCEAGQALRRATTKNT